MLTRLWFVVSLAWAAFCLAVIALGHDTEPIGWGVWLVICGPFLIGLLLKRIGRYVARGN